MPSGKVTFTGNMGPGLSVSSKVFNNLTKVEFDFARNLLLLYGYDANNQYAVQSVDYSSIGTFTAAVAGGVTSITLS